MTPEIESARWYAKAAGKGNPSALFIMSFLVKEGIGVAQDDQKATDFGLRAVEAMEELAKTELGSRYASFAGMHEDTSLVTRWYHELAEEGLAEAQTIVGYMYKRGYCVEQDYAVAAKWLRAAAEQGHFTAQNKLGILFNRGMGVEPDLQEASRWFRKAADQGHGMAQFNLWELLASNSIEPKDGTGALYYLHLAAMQGVSVAQVYMGLFYQTGLGLEQNEKSGVRWYRRAAENGNPDGQSGLAFALFLGKGVAQSKVDALMWLDLAIEGGKENLKKSREQMIREMSADEVEKADKRMRQWQHDQASGTVHVRVLVCDSGLGPEIWHPVIEEAYKGMDGVELEIIHIDSIEELLERADESTPAWFLITINNAFIDNNRKCGTVANCPDDIFERIVRKLRYEYGKPIYCFTGSDEERFQELCGKLEVDYFSPLNQFDQTDFQEMIRSKL